MKGTKAAATVHSGIDPGGPHGSPTPTPAPIPPARQAGLPPQKEWLEKQEFPPATISPPARGRGLPEALFWPSPQPVCAGSKGEAGKPRTSSSQTLLPVSSANNSQNDGKRFGWPLPGQGTEHLSSNYCIQGTEQGEPEIPDPLKRKDPNWSGALPLASCVASGKWLCLSESHLYTPLGAGPAWSCTEHD